MSGRNAVVLTSDARLFPAAAFVADRLSGLNNRADTDILVYTDSDADIAIAGTFGVRFGARKIDPALANGFRTRGQMSRAAYYWFFVPQRIGDAYERVLYMDVDTYPETDKVFALFDLDMRGCVFAGSGA